MSTPSKRKRLTDVSVYRFINRCRNSATLTRAFTLTSSPELILLRGLLVAGIVNLAVQIPNLAISRFLDCYKIALHTDFIHLHFLFTHEDATAPVGFI